MAVQLRLRLGEQRATISWDAPAATPDVVQEQPTDGRQGLSAWDFSSLAQRIGEAFATDADGNAVGSRAVALLVDEHSPLVPLELLPRLPRRCLEAELEVILSPAVLDASPCAVSELPVAMLRELGRALRATAALSELAPPLRQLCQAVAGALREVGWFRLVLDAADLAVVLRSRAAFDAFSTTTEQRRKHHVVSKRSKFAGYAGQPRREFFQCRRLGAKVNEKALWPDAEFEAAAAAHLELMHELGELCLLAALAGLGREPGCVPPLWGGGPGAAAGEQLGDEEFGSGVLRLYRYTAADPGAAAKAAKPGVACGVHADLGLLSLSPTASTAGLTLLHGTKRIWMDVEAGCAPEHCCVFGGESLGRLTNGAIRAPLHFVDERLALAAGVVRHSAPFFFRARPEAVLAEGVTTAQFIEGEVFTSRPWRGNGANGKGSSKPGSDY